METPSKLLEQIAFNTTHKIEEHMLIVMNKSSQKEHLAQPIQTNKKQYKISVTFLTGYIGIFKVTIKDNKFYFTVPNNDNDVSQIKSPPGAYELESSKYEIKRNIIKDGYFTDEHYPFIIKPNFYTLSSILKIQPIFIGTQINFIHDDSNGDPLGFDSVVIYEKKQFIAKSG